MTSWSCYRVELPTTNSLRNAAQHRDGYVTVEDGCLYVVAVDAGAVGAEFPQARAIARVGAARPCLPVNSPAEAVREK